MTESDQIGSSERPLRVAIIGAGPSGFYAAGSLLKQRNHIVAIDMLERLPAPHGLVRYGVAPDHQNIKAVAKIYDRTAATDGFRFFGNVEFGSDILHEEIERHYDAVIYASGAQSDRKLNVPGEDLPNSMSATEFVAWYNGHPEYVDLEPDLSCAAAMVVGVGNVAMDVARVLAKSMDELKLTDISDHALEVLAESKIRDIYVVARRGPAQVKFTNAEIREFGHLDLADIVVDPLELKLDSASSASIEGDTSAQKNIDYLRAYSEIGETGKDRRVHFRFLLSPEEIVADEEGRISGVRVVKNTLRPTVSGYINATSTDDYEFLGAGLVLRSVGYRGIPLAGVPFDERRGTIPNNAGRVIELATEQEVPGTYVVGWAKRGPTGVIGTNKPDAVETVNSLIYDLEHGRLPQALDPDPDAIIRILEERNVRCVTNQEWQKLNAMEVEKGQAQGRPRVKFVSVEAMLAVLDGD